MQQGTGDSSDNITTDDPQHEANGSPEVNSDNEPGERMSSEDSHDGSSGEVMNNDLEAVMSARNEQEVIQPHCQSKNVESNAYALDSARIQISLGLRQQRAHWIQARWIHLE
jgi:hypothetical protein